MDQKAWNAQLFVKLYSKLSLALGVAPPKDDAEVVKLFGGPVPRPGSLVAPGGKDNPQFLLTVFNPGQYIPSTLEPDKNKDDRYALSILFNSVPQFSWFYVPAANTVSGVYHSILDNKQAPESHLTDQQQKALATAEATLDKWYEKYKEYWQKYLPFLDKYDDAVATADNGGPPVRRSVVEELKAALSDWEVLGHRSTVDSATAVIATYAALEPETFWVKLQERYQSGTQRANLGSDYQVLGFFPPYKSWIQDAGWTQFTFDQTDMDNQHNSDAIGVSGNLDGKFGIFRIEGEGSFEQESRYTNINETRLSLSCKLMRVTFDRGWMNPLVFGSRAWRWTPAFSGTVISSGGDIVGSVIPTGTMTVLPTAAILSKDLKIEGSIEKTIVEDLKRDIKANASVGIGPFAIAGRFNMGTQKESPKGSIETTGIQARDMQLIALICEVLPKSPNPDPALKWPEGS